MGERDGLSEWHCNAFRVQLLLHFPDIATFTKSAKLNDTFNELHAMSSGRGVFDWHCNACRVQLVIYKFREKGLHAANALYAKYFENQSPCRRKNPIDSSEIR
jgi:hypothetical protein